MLTSHQFSHNQFRPFVPQLPLNSLKPDRACSQVDHDTTRTRTRLGRRLVRTDPHVTVYMACGPRNIDYERHLFLVRDRRKVPTHVARRHELRLYRGPNRELWYYRSGISVPCSMECWLRSSHWIRFCGA